MIRYAIALVFSVSMLNAQDNTSVTPKNMAVGDIFEIGQPETNRYKHIKFPKANFIIKRGGIADYKRV